MTSFAYVFPGQGSQTIGMLSELSHAFEPFRATFNRASDAVGFDIWALVQQGPQEKLNQTEFTQVAMLVSDVAIANVMKSHAKLSARVMAGHSLGEYAALVVAESLSLEEAARLVQLRGRLMQQYVPIGTGAMAAIVGLTDEQVRTICNDVSRNGKSVAPANYNAIGQVVIAGFHHAVNDAIVLAEAQGARLAKLIPVSVPCHCDLLQETAKAYQDALRDYTFKTPVVPVISNVDLSVYRDDSHIRSLLVKQLYCPVRWVETVTLMKQMGASTLFEVGPGKVLSGLIKRIDREINTMSVNDECSLSAWSLMLTKE